MDDILNRVIKPRDCALGFGIPTDLASFAAARDTKDPRRFSASYAWREYHQLILPFGNFIPLYERLGVKVAGTLRKGEVQRLFEDDADVVVLFSHWDKSSGQVEFRDGFASADEIVAQIPARRDCLIDLSICHPLGLAEAIERARHPECRIRYADSKIPAASWLAFLSLLFRILYDVDLRYGDALLLATRTWVGASPRKSIRTKR